MAEGAEKEGGGGGSAKLVIIIIVGALVLVLASMGGLFFLLKTMGMLGGGGGGAAPVHVEAPAEELKPAIYHAFDPAFVVNFKDGKRTRFLQVAIEVMTRDPEVVKALDAHSPIIRNNFLLLFSGQTGETLYSAEGKEQLRVKALEELQSILEAETGSPGVEALYFTSFVTQ